jgi:hypothetical protein
MRKQIILVISFIIFFAGIVIAREVGDAYFRDINVARNATIAAATIPSITYTATTYVSSNTVVSYGISAATATFSGAISAATLNTGQGANELYDMNQNVLTTSDVSFASATITNTATAGTFTDGTASITAGAISGATTIAASSATITNTVQASVLRLAVDLDTASAPSATGIIGIDSFFDVYVSTGTGAGDWALVGSQS